MSGKVTDYIDKYYNELHCNCAQTVFCSAVEAWELDVPADARRWAASLRIGTRIWNARPRGRKSKPLSA